MSDIRSRDRSFLDLLEVGPDAATVILAAYESGRLPMKKGAKPADAREAETYLARSDELTKQIAERERRERAVKDQVMRFWHNLAALTTRPSTP
ncbi:hypothetical protein ACFKHW_04220 [Bradyrhizobium lupini]|uniref:hypothetical protein n=1 Tax=Rhizobium lupini TaxID=136996 RepID=UPI00366B00EE